MYMFVHTCVLQSHIPVFVDGEDRDMTMNDLKNMKYLDCVIKEALRIYPSVPFFARQLQEECQIG